MYPIVATRLFHEAAAAALEPLSGKCKRVLHILQHRDSRAQWLGNIMFGLLSERLSLEALAALQGMNITSLVETTHPLHSGLIPWHNMVGIWELEQPLLASQLCSGEMKNSTFPSW